MNSTQNPTGAPLRRRKTDFQLSPGYGAGAHIHGGTITLALVPAVEWSPTTYSLETAARLAEMHPEMLRYYCRLGLFGEAREHPTAELFFDEAALQELHRFEYYRVHHGIDRQTLRLICGLRREVERLKNELRSLRVP
jgi:hypothetical protein